MLISGQGLVRRGSPPSRPFSFKEGSQWGLRMTCLLAIDLDAREKAVGTVGGGGLKRAVSCGLITGGRIFLSAPPGAWPRHRGSARRVLQTAAVRAREKYWVPGKGTRRCYQKEVSSIT